MSSRRADEVLMRFRLMNTPSQPGRGSYLLPATFQVLPLPAAGSVVRLIVSTYPHYHRLSKGSARQAAATATVAER